MESADLVLPSPLWPNSLWRKAGNVSEPVIVTAIQAGFKMEAVNFLKNVKSFFSNTTVILFDMGLSKSDFDFVKQACDIYNGQEDNMTDGEERSYYDYKESIRLSDTKKSGFKNRELYHSNVLRDNSFYSNRHQEKIKDSSEETSTANVCQLRSFDPELVFPSHTRRLSNGAFRPLIIQDVLKDTGCVLWMNIEQRFVSNETSSILEFALNRDLDIMDDNHIMSTSSNSNRRGGGIAAWRMKENRPTTSMTHPNMFGRLHVWPSKDETSSRDTKLYDTIKKDDKIIESYRFQHMVDMQALLMYNTQNVRDDLMIPWIKCALTPNCIEPIGAQGIVHNAIQVWLYVKYYFNFKMIS